MIESLDVKIEFVGLNHETMMMFNLLVMFIGNVEKVPKTTNDGFHH